MLYTACVTVLPPCFKQNHGDGVGKIHAPAAGLHGQAQLLPFGQGVEDFGGQAACLGAEQKNIALNKRNFVGTGFTFGGQRKNAAARAVVRTALYEGVDVYGVHNGYSGMVHDDIEQLTSA